MDMLCDALVKEKIVDKLENIKLIREARVQLIKLSIPDTNEVDTESLSVDISLRSLEVNETVFGVPTDRDDIRVDEENNEMFQLYFRTLTFLLKYFLRERNFNSRYLGGISSSTLYAMIKRFLFRKRQQISSNSLNTDFNANENELEYNIFDSYADALLQFFDMYKDTLVDENDSHHFAYLMNLNLAEQIMKSFKDSYEQITHTCESKIAIENNTLLGTILTVEKKEPDPNENLNVAGTAATEPETTTSSDNNFDVNDPWNTSYANENIIKQRKESIEILDEDAWGAEQPTKRQKLEAVVVVEQNNGIITID